MLRRPAPPPSSEEGEEVIKPEGDQSFTAVFMADRYWEVGAHLDGIADIAEGLLESCSEIRLTTTLEFKVEPGDDYVRLRCPTVT